MTIKVLCVLKSGGDFDGRYVDKLEQGVWKNLKIPYDFICLTDIPEQVSCKTILLKDNLPGWWSKIELFKIPGPVVYFDLDTVILGDITKLAEAVLVKEVERFFMLKPFNPHNKHFGSGVMAWSGDYSYIHGDFIEKKKRNMHSRFGDQRYIANKLVQSSIEYVQDCLPGVYSYKRHIMISGIPDDTSVICFHGQPRPINVKAIWNA